jgi:hypothetical protein
VTDDSYQSDARPDRREGSSRQVEARPRRAISVQQSLLLAAGLATVIGGLAFQLGLGDTSFDRPGQLVLLFVDIAPVLWFAAAPVIVHALRWRAIDHRFRWVFAAAVMAAAVAVVMRITIGGESLLSTVLDPFTVAFVLWIAAALQWTRTRVKRLAANRDHGITIVGMALGFAVASIGLALGALRLSLVGPATLPGSVPQASGASPETALLIAATFAMIAALFWLTDRTRNR